MVLKVKNKETISSTKKPGITIGLDNLIEEYNKKITQGKEVNHLSEISLEQNRKIRDVNLVVTYTNYILKNLIISVEISTSIK